MVNFNLDSVGASVLNKKDLTQLEKLLLNEESELQVVAHEYLKDFSQEEISYFCVKHGFYVIPTIELLTFIQDEIGEYKLEEVMEIGAGHGAISRTMGIRAVDNFMQESPKIKAYYEALQQATVPYGKHVQRIDGNSAIERYSPKIVIGAYCTHKYNPNEHFRGGNEFGFKEEKIVKKVKKYIHIGNRQVHGKKPILKFKPREVKADWLVTRSVHAKDNIIWIWEK